MELMLCPKCKCSWFEEREIAQYDKEVINFLTSIVSEQKKLLYVCVNCGHTIASQEKQEFKDVQIIVFARESSRINYLKVKNASNPIVLFKSKKSLNNTLSVIPTGSFFAWKDVTTEGYKTEHDGQLTIEYGYIGLGNSDIILLTNEEYSKFNEKIKQDYPEDKYNVEIVDKTED